MQRRPLRAALLAAALLVGALVVLATVQPVLAAAACPACFGFEPIDRSAFIDRSATPDQRARARTMVQAAERTVGAFYGGQRSDPRLFVCTTEACYRRVGGGGSHGMAILDLALFLSPQGLSDTIAAHELAHVELHARLGRLATLRRDIPQWFDEGVAVVISQDPRYPLAASPQACAEAMQGDLPTTRGAWVHDAQHDRLYAKAAQRIGCWMSAHGGAVAVAQLIERVAGGEPFPAAYE